MLSYQQNRWYLFDGSLIRAYGHQLNGIVEALLIRCITSKGETFLLPVTEPWPGYPDSWKDSLLEIAGHASNEWVKITSNNESKRFEVVEAAEFNQLNPVVWPEESLENIVNKAFPGSYFVDSLEHPLMAELYSDR